MQILSVSADHYASNRNYLEQMHRLRAAVFGGRLEWDITVTEQVERDQYDDLRPTYILAISADQKVVACARLLPASGPTMLERTFPQLLERGSLDAHAAVVESSRFCVDTSQAAGRGGSIHQATLAMFAGIIEWSMTNGYAEIVTATDLRFERILKRAGWPLRRLGDPLAIGNTVAVAGSLPADRASFEQVCPQGYRSTIERNGAGPLRSAA
ncbi:autoinducer synthase (plasmid) [Aminobacter sp. Y103A]|uniref:acyl-homoserine-lactone synthase n=1 Tax=Aminobacter sp. Y103A TaxID=1870862 RepID=UPI00257292A1|nr:acyl-homoserine-lactone synthase TraI [Aminobacter sp. SS-2016]BBD41520.1 autoinducer synthase [Aminobacter sp. SS-2016]